MPTHQELVHALGQVCSRVQKIKERVAEIDQQIKNSSVNNVDKIEAELVELRNDYYEVQARELLGEYDSKEKREIEDKISAAEKRLKTEGGILHNLLGIRHALEAEFKNTQGLEEQYQAALEKLEFENIQADRQKLAEEINRFSVQMKDLFRRVADYNSATLSSASKLLNREYQLKGYPDGIKGNGAGQEQVLLLAQPLDLNLVKNTLAETLSEIASNQLSS